MSILRLFAALTMQIGAKRMPPMLFPVLQSIYKIINNPSLPGVYASFTLTLCKMLSNYVSLQMCTFAREFLCLKHVRFHAFSIVLLHCERVTREMWRLLPSIQLCLTQHTAPTLPVVHSTSHGSGARSGGCCPGDRGSRLVPPGVQ